MPQGNYSYSSESAGVSWQSYAISEPDSHRSADPRHTSWDQDGIQAKEPDRQTTTRRSSSRGRMNQDYDEEQSPRGRSSARGRGAQARRGGGAQTARRTAETRTGRQKKSRRGFAAMSPEQQREIARKGGLTVSRNRRHMADIGRVGGEHSHGGRRTRR